MTEIKRGDIWFVNLDPTIGHEIKKTRLCIILQNDIGNKYSNTTIIGPITSQNTQKIYPIEVLLTNENSGLEKESKVVLAQIRAVDKRRLLKKLSRVDEITLTKIDEALKISLGLI